MQPMKKYYVLPIHFVSDDPLTSLNFLKKMSTTLSTLSALFTTGSFLPLSASPSTNETDIIWMKNPKGKTYYKSQYLGRGASAKVYEVNEVLLDET